MNRMCGIVCSGILASVPAWSADLDRSLSLPLAAGAQLRIEAGAGQLKVEGREGQTSVEVKARVISNLDAKELEQQLASGEIVLRLEKRGEGAILRAEIRKESWFSFGAAPRIDLVVTVPRALRLSVLDGSGATDIRNLQGDVDIEDGSGDLTVEDIAGSVTIEDGSGELRLGAIAGDLRVEDGSGAMKIWRIGGTVTIHDGSGGIDIDDVAKDVVLKSTGSGGDHIRNVKGRILR